MPRPQQTTALPAAEPELDAAIDAFAAVMDGMAAASTSETGGARMRAWERHLLVLEPPPGERPEVPVDRRRWGGARGAALGWIHEEVGKGGRRRQELQDTLWVLVRGLSETLQAEAVRDAGTAACVERLRAADEMPPDELRAVVIAAVDKLGEILDARRTEQERISRSLSDRIRSLSDDLESARREADLDPLTQLANRGALDRGLSRAVDLAALTGDPATLVLLDLDDFKGVNDEHGHRVGDEVIRAFSSHLVRAFPRRSDLVARYGGDEFAVLLLNARPDDALRLVGGLTESLAVDVLSSQHPALRVSVSVGIAALGPHRTVQAVVDAADRALYRAKAGGRGQAVVDEESLPGRS